MPTSTHRDEGYIKFSFAHEAAPPPAHPRLHDLMRIRDDLHEWELIGVLPDGIGYGNLSARIGDSPRFASSPPAAPDSNIPLNRTTSARCSPSISPELRCLPRAAARLLGIHEPRRDLRRAPRHAPSSTSTTASYVQPAGPGRRAADAVRRRLRHARNGPRRRPPRRHLPPAAVLVMAGHEDGLSPTAPIPAPPATCLWDAYSRSRRE
jgi:hypothetical protein